MMPSGNHTAGEKAPPLRRSAGCQTAVSPIANRQSVPITFVTPGPSAHPQAGSPAIQQVGNLRYDFDAGPDANPQPLVIGHWILVIGHSLLLLLLFVSISAHAQPTQIGRA